MCAMDRGRLQAATPHGPFTPLQTTAAYRGLPRPGRGRDGRFAPHRAHEIDSRPLPERAAALMGRGRRSPHGASRPHSKTELLRAAVAA